MRPPEVDMKRVVITIVMAVLNASSATAQGRGGSQTSQIVSPEVRTDGRITFRISAPDAEKVELRTPGDIPGSVNPNGRGLVPFPLTKNTDRVWEATLGPVPAGAYRYVFVVNGLPVVDSRDPLAKPNNPTVYTPRSLPGA